MQMLAFLFVACVSRSGNGVTARATNVEVAHEVPASTLESQDVFTLRQSFYHDFDQPESGAVFISHDQGKQATAFGFVAAEYPALTLRPRYQEQQNPSGPRDDRQMPIGIVANDPASNHTRLPDVRDKTTVVNLAKMTSDAYLHDPSLPAWMNLTNGFNRSHSFGWPKNGLRGHVFSNADNTTVVVSFKGTTINPGEPTRNHDRDNDNVLFSCCCATQRSDPYFWWRPICPCRTGNYACNSTCLTNECGRDDRYYATARELVTQKMMPRYPGAQFWFTGHSLGGAVASLMGMTFHAPAVTFESPPERLAAERLSLTRSNQTFPYIFHFGNTADPIYMGGCHGFRSACAFAGYAFETKCFSGSKCVYDTRRDKGWFTDVLNHRIEIVITGVLEQYPDVPECFAETDCADCERWTFS